MRPFFTRRDMLARSGLGLGALGAIRGFAGAAALVLLVALFVVGVGTSGHTIPWKRWLLFMLPLWLYQLCLSLALQVDLSVLKSTGVYAQLPGSNPLAGKTCGVGQVYVEDFESLPPGAAKFALVTGIIAGVEGTLGTNSAGATRPKTNPCP